ncbi:MAG: hypothetical protein ACLR7U_04920 [Ruthenibacterium lactatiformans]
MAGHRILAVDRGEREGFLKVSVTVDAARAVRLLTERTVKNDSPAQSRCAAAEDAYAPYTPQPGAGGARGPDGARLRGSHQRIQQKPAAAFAAAAHQGEGGPRA